MTSIITGDIISSKSGDPNLWLPALKRELNKYGTTPKHWEIYRGDSFQLEVSPKTALKTALLLKATIKQFKTIDVRLAIGVGEKTYDADSITESNGSAFVNSGACFEALKKSTLAIKTQDSTFNTTINIMLDLALLTMDNWTPKASLLFKTTLEHSNYNQVDIAKLLDRKQSNISAGLKRTGYDEISKMLDFYNSQL
ncbi:MAG: transcriptional regulator [Bizionia sp.]|nr:transcriptional regulator [Bizionia sp.]